MALHMRQHVLGRPLHIDLFFEQVLFLRTGHNFPQLFAIAMARLS